MPLIFPTQAEQAIAAWRELTVTKPFQSIAKPLGAFRDDEWQWGQIIWIFPDDSRVVISGRGRSYSIQADLP